MLSTPHILVGGAIVKFIPNPLISLPLAFLSHFLFDFIPHWDFKISLKPNLLLSAFADYAIGLSLIFWLSLGDVDQLVILLGGISATLPDFVLGSQRVLNLKFLEIWPLNLMNNFHMEIQNRVSVFWGLVFSIITILASTYILIQ